MKFTEKELDIIIAALEDAAACYDERRDYEQSQIYTDLADKIRRDI